MDQPDDRSAHDLLSDEHANDCLERVAVRDVMRSPAVVFVGADHLSLREGAGRRRLIFVVERDGRFSGWLDISEMEDGQTARDLVVHADPGTVAVSPDAALKEALQHMVDSGLRSVPVTDVEHRLMGEVTLAAIEDVVAAEDPR
ncbi:MAG: CBS domain-containing protein [Actinobacteria bacterium]|nr:CBS domain-containing protein [Actinomycetota bacterium]